MVDDVMSAAEAFEKGFAPLEAQARFQLDDLISSLNKGRKGGPLAIDLRKDDPFEGQRFISTGSTLLDYAISNRADGGIPEGKVIDIAGFNSAGKSLMGAVILANTQKAGGLAILIDTEFAANFEFMDMLGVDRENNFLYLQPNNLEECFVSIEKIINLVIAKRAAGNDRPVTIVWDSVSATKPAAQHDADYDFNMNKNLMFAKQISGGMSKALQHFDKANVTLVVTNHLKNKIGAAMGEDEFYSPGGETIPYYASVRIRLHHSKRIKPKDGENALKRKGMVCRSEVIKTRFGPPFRQMKFPIYFAEGIGDIESWYPVLREQGYISGTNPKRLHKKGASKGEGIPFQYSDSDHSGWMELIKTDPEAHALALSFLNEHLVMKYIKRGGHTTEVPDVN